MSPTSAEPAPADRVARLERALAEARAQLAATGEILTAIGRSDADVDAVLATIVETAIRLCRADAAGIYLLHDRVFEVAASQGFSQELLQHVRTHPIVTDRATLIGRVAIDRRAQQIADVLSDPEFGRLDVQRLGGVRTVSAVPMEIDQEVVGVLTMWRRAVDPFSDHDMGLATTFTAQAALAIRSVDLVGALQSRTTELDAKVGQLEALREVGQAVSSSLDLDEVLTRIVTLAVRLTGTGGGSLLELDPDARTFQVRAAFGTQQRLLDELRSTRISLDETLVGLACLTGEPQVAADLDVDPLDPHLHVLQSAGWRSVLAVPVQHEGDNVGALVVRRRTPGGFTADTAGLLQTFASQSALAIVHARLFHELQRKSAELQVASRHKSEFLASMSHELRTPLNAVIGFSEVLLDRMFGDINERQEEYLQDILGSGRHLLELLNDILDLSKVEAGRMEIELSDVDVNAVLDHAVAQVRERAAAHSIVVLVEALPEGTTAVTDQLRLRQVVVNLMSNAVKFTPDGGRITLRATATETELTVTVSDTGVGVGPDDIERIFEPFEQAGRPRAKSEGTGLGLALCRRILDVLGGHMWVESELGVGSTFGFTVPMQGAEARGVA